MSADIVISRSPETLPESAYLSRRPPRYTLRTQTEISRDIGEVFAFFSDAKNLARITPPDMGFTILTPLPIAMGTGTVIDYRVRIMRAPIKWRTVIDVWEPGRRFVDSQDRGPYASWWHEHCFEQRGEACLMTDTVHYAPPLGALGAVAQHLLIARELRRIFSFRARFIRAHFAQAASNKID